MQWDDGRVLWSKLFFKFEDLDTRILCGSFYSTFAPIVLFSEAATNLCEGSCNLKLIKSKSPSPFSAEVEVKKAAMDHVLNNEEDDKDK